jgi:hypothetical protein
MTGRANLCPHLVGIWTIRMTQKRVVTVNIQCVSVHVVRATRSILIMPLCRSVTSFSRPLTYNIRTAGETHSSSFLSSVRYIPLC